MGDQAPCRVFVNQNTCLHVVYDVNLVSGGLRQRAMKGP